MHCIAKYKCGCCNTILGGGKILDIENPSEFLDELLTHQTYDFVPGTTDMLSDTPMYIIHSCSDTSTGLARLIGLDSLSDEQYDMIMNVCNQSAKENAE